MVLINLLAAEGNGSWLPHDIKEVFWGTIAFLIVAFLLNKFGAKAVRDALVGRTERINNELAGAADARREAEQARDQIKADLADSSSKADAIVDDARKAAPGVTEEIITRAEASVALMRERAAAENATAEAQALSDIEGEFGRLAYGAAEKVVDANLDDATQQRLIDDYIARVAAN